MMLSYCIIITTFVEMLKSNSFFLHYILFSERNETQWGRFEGEMESSWPQIQIYSYKTRTGTG